MQKRHLPSARTFRSGKAKQLWPRNCDKLEKRVPLTRSFLACRTSSSLLCASSGSKVANKKRLCVSRENAASSPGSSGPSPSSSKSADSVRSRMTGGGSSGRLPVLFYDSLR